MLTYEIYPKSLYKPKKLVIMLHGYGSNRNDLIHIAPDLYEFIPQSSFISPNAPFIFEGRIKSLGRQWFSLTDRSKQSLSYQIKKSETLLKNFIIEQLEKFNLTEKDLCLLGFSQGAMMAIHILLKLQIKPAVVVGFSGKLLQNEYEFASRSTQKITKVLLIHGQKDDIILVEDMYEIQKLLQSYHYQTFAYVSKKLGHGIDQEGVKLCSNFLKRFLYNN